MRLKEGSRVLAIDDSPFKRGYDSRTFLVGLMFRGLILEVAIRKTITVDGRDSTEAILGMTQDERIGGEVKLIMTHGTTFAGLNVLDMKFLYSSLGVPIMAVVNKEPTDEMVSALRAAGLHDRIKIVEENPPFERFDTGRGSVYCSYIGLDRREVARILERDSVESKIPEQLRIADLVASLLEGLAR